MLEKISNFVSEVVHSVDFTYSHKQGEPASYEAIKELVHLFKQLGHEAPRSLVELYQANDGFTFRWMYKHSTHADYITVGDVDIPSIDLVITWLRHVPTEDIPLDFVSDINQVSFRVGRSGIGLFYTDLDLDESFPLSIDVDQYLHLLDESRGLYPWRELFIKSPSFQINPELKEKFFTDLGLLFEDVDPALFRQRDEP